jgi:hypothetical protein
MKPRPRKGALTVLIHGEQVLVGFSKSLERHKAASAVGCCVWSVAGLSAEKFSLSLCIVSVVT